MKRRFLGLVSAALLFGLVACGNNPEPTPGPTPGPDPVEPVDELAEARTAAKAEVQTYAEAKGEDNYTEANWTTILGHVNTAKAAIDAAETSHAIEAAVDTAKAAIDAVAVITIEELQQAAIAEIAAYVAALNEEDYSTTNWAIIVAQQVLASAGVALCETKEEIADFVATFKAGVDGVETKAEEELAEAKETGKGEIDTYVSHLAEEDYEEEDWATLQFIVSTAKAAIDAAETAEAITGIVTQALEYIGDVPQKDVSSVVTLYFTNNKSWDVVNLYAWKEGSDPLEKNAEWPGVALANPVKNEYNQDVYPLEVDKEVYDHIIFNNGNGAQSVNIDISEKNTNDAFYLTDDTDSEGHIEVGTWTYIPSDPGDDDTLVYEFTWTVDWVFNDNAVIYAWIIDGEDQGAWQGVEILDGESIGVLTEVATDYGLTKVVLVRFAQGTAVDEASWEVMLNQTEDITISSGVTSYTATWIEGQP